MPTMIDPNDLIDSHDIAGLLGLSSSRAVSVYRSRYADFPSPLIDRGTGRCLLWLRADIEAWAEGRIGPRAGHRITPPS